MKTIIVHRLCVVSISLIAALNAGGVQATEIEVTIGVLAFRGAEQAHRRWTPTADYLTLTVDDARFRIKPMSLAAMGAAVATGSVDFILTNTGNYVSLENQYGISRIVTLQALRSAESGNVFGAVIFTRTDRTDLTTISDLVGKRFMAVERAGFGGFQMAWRELAAIGIDPLEDFEALSFSGFPQDEVAYAVRDGVVDAGTFRTGVLESLAGEGKINLDDFRVLNQQTHAGFSFLVSTRLYPEWPFAKLKHTNANLAQQVAIALLSMSPESTAASAGKYGGWTVPLDYQPVHGLFRELRIGPYKELGEITLSDLTRQYGHWIVFGFVIILLTVARATRIEYQVAKRTAELSKANAELERQIAERRRLEAVARQRQAELAHVSRLNTMGEMASGLAHELNQPLSAITNYARGCVRRIKSGSGERDELQGAMEQVAVQAERAAAIIRRIRNFVRKGDPKRKPADMNHIIRDVAGLLGPDMERDGVSINIELCDPMPTVMADTIQIEQIILNLARNAIEAMSDASMGGGLVTIRTRVSDSGNVEVDVSDSGPGINPEMSDHIFNPFFTTKASGMGLGLSISRSIAELHGGTLEVCELDGGGTAFRLSLPVALDETGDDD